jgi:hypothetical protein
MLRGCPRPPVRWRSRALPCPDGQHAQAGDRYAQAVTVEPGQCLAMVHDGQGGRPTAQRRPWTERWYGPRDDGTQLASVELSKPVRHQ